MHVDLTVEADGRQHTGSGSYGGARESLSVAARRTPTLHFTLTLVHRNNIREYCGLRTNNNNTREEKNGARAPVKEKLVITVIERCGLLPVY